MTTMISYKSAPALITVAFFIGCDLFTPSDKPRGSDSFSAAINGVPRTFTTIRPVNDIDGFSVDAISGTDTIRMLLAYGNVGEYVWKEYRRPQQWGDTSATFNSIPALPDVGGFTIVEHDTQLLKVVGTFLFTAVDTAKSDTVYVTNGAFTLFWTYAN